MSQVFRLVWTSLSTSSMTDTQSINQKSTKTDCTINIVLCCQRVFFGTLTIPSCLCWSLIWSVWLQILMRAPSAVWPRSSLDSSGAPNTGATARYQHTCITYRCSTTKLRGFESLTSLLHSGVEWCVQVCMCLLQVEKLWALLCPLLRKALSNITIETYADWGTCIATACVRTPLSLFLEHKLIF